MTRTDDTVPPRLNAPFLDRRVPGELLHELRDGVFGWVTDLARESLDARRPLDLGLRKDSKTQQAHATLYLGTTKVLDVVRGRAGTFKLKSEAQGGEFSAIQEPFEKAWTRAQPLKHLARDMPRIRTRVEAAIGAAPTGRMKEGFLQAAIAKAADPSFVPVDREVMLAWQTTPVKTAGKARLRIPLERAQARLATEHAWAGGRRSAGDKIDALAIDSSGRLLVIEVKPGSETDTLAWTPVQVAMYLQLVRAWVTDIPTMAVRVLRGMAQQRIDLGLAAGPVPELDLTTAIVPVIALGTPVRRPEDAERRFSAVRHAVTDAGVALDALELWTIDSAGVVKRTDAATLDGRFA